MDFFIQQSITSVVISAIAKAVAAIQAKHEDKILTFCEIIRKSLLLKNSPSAMPSLNPNASAKASTLSNAFLKVIEK